MKKSVIAAGVGLLLCFQPQVSAQVKTATAGAESKTTQTKTIEAKSTTQTVAVTQSAPDEQSEPYYYPPLGGRLYPSANFGEARTDHFHSGVDIKTGGVEGKPLYSVADGYIARIAIAPYGYGRALYIAHPDGTTSVYAHMQKFTPAVETYVDDARYRQRKHNVDLYPEAGKFTVKRGELIGHSGNSGSSMGPHLHFEIRETASQRPVNVLAKKYLDIKDDIPPTIVKLHYISTDTIGGIPVHGPVRSLAVKKQGASNYTLADTSALEVARNGYFVLECTDRKNDTHNTMGIYSVAMDVDAERVFGFSIDGFLFSERRYVNSLTHYALQKGSRNELIRLAVQDNNKLKFYKDVKNKGAVNLKDHDLHDVMITVLDDNGNSSLLTFRVRGKSTAEPEKKVSGAAVNYDRHFYHNFGNVEVSIPARTLYESIYMMFSERKAPAPTNKAEVGLFTPMYAVHTADVPLHTNISLGIRTSGIRESLQPKLCLARVADNGRYTYAGGQYAQGKVTGEVRNFGNYVVVADSIPPSVTPSFANNADLKAVKSVAFTITDNFSGVKSYTGTIDGEWVAFEQQGSKITHIFNPSRIKYSGGNHTFVLTVEDNKGNKRTVKRTFLK